MYSKSQVKFASNVLSDIVVYNKYAKYVPELNRRETWSEIVDRYIAMMIKKYPLLEGKIKEYGQYLYDKKVLMSMRAAQFAGPAIESNNARMFNCAYLPIDDVDAFKEVMFLLLGGTGVGFSVRNIHISKLPKVVKPSNRSRVYKVDDSIEGWANAIDVLIKSYLPVNGKVKANIKFDFSNIRLKGERLITAGGKAPGPEPLMECLESIRGLLDAKVNGDSLRDIEVHDIICYIAKSVRSGGIRRSALISLFDNDSKQMLECKQGEWWVNNSQRALSNNSAVLDRYMLDNGMLEDKFNSIFNACKDSYAGEPGMFVVKGNKYGTNPCAEISLREFTFCNLTEINAGTILNRKDFYNRVKVATFFGTLQAGFVDFKYLRSKWKRNTVKDSLVGVGITGICNGKLLDLVDKHKGMLYNAAKLAKRVNKYYANVIDIPTAARVTTIKPAGTTSCVLGCSSGIHAWYGNEYIRNMQCGVGDDLYNFFVTHYPKLIKVMDYDKSSAVIGIPQIAPSNAVIRDNETAIDSLERVIKFNTEWVRAGHRRGPNYNNVSATINVREHEWESVREYMYNNRKLYNGLSLLPYDNGTYKDAPFEVVDKQVLLDKLKYIRKHKIDLTLIQEEDDNTDLVGEAACIGGQCDIIM